MKKYIVTIVETLRRDVEVYANNLSDAKYKVEDKYKNGAIILMPEDYAYSDFTVKELPIKNKTADMER